MKQVIKTIIKALIGSERTDRLILFKIALANYGYDFLLYRKFSTVFKANSLQNIEALITLQYHGVKKIIGLIPIGIAKEEFRVTLSKRRELDEVFGMVNIK